MAEIKQEIYIAGHSGFIGSNIKKALSARNVKYFEINNLNEIQRRSEDVILINLIGRGMVREKKESSSEIMEANYEKAVSLAHACLASNWRMLHLGSYPADYGHAPGPYYESKKRAFLEIREIVPEGNLTIFSPDIVVGQNHNSFPCRAYSSLKQNRNIKIENPDLVRNFIRVEDLSNKIAEHVLKREQGIIAPVLSSTNWRVDSFFNTLHAASRIFANNSNYGISNMNGIEDEFLKLDHLSVGDLPVALSILECVRYMEGAND